MSINDFFFPDGLGQTSGDSWGITKDWYSSGNVIYLSSVDGDDSNVGFSIQEPKATLSAAVGACSAGWSIVVAGNHAETITSAVSVTVANLAIIGAGTSGGLPTAKFGTNSASSGVLAITGADYTKLRNLKFVTGLQSNSAPRVGVGVSSASANVTLSGCLFESTALDTGPALGLVDDLHTTISDCIFNSTGTTGAATEAVVVTASKGVGMRMSNCVFDGGTDGWDKGIAFSGLGTLTNIVVEGTSLLNGSNMSFSATSTGRVSTVSTTGGSKLLFTSGSTINANVFPNGLGEGTGDALVTSSPLYSSGFVRYVSSVLGDDSNTGLERLQPKLTLASAVTASSALDIIVLASDYDETVSSGQAISLAGLTIVGAGTDSSGDPTATIRTSSSENGIFSVEADYVQIRNVYFPPSGQADSGIKLSVGTGGTMVSYLEVAGCKFDLSDNDTGASLRVVNADNALVENCTLLSTVVTTPGAVAFTVTDAAPANLTIRDCLFDGGTKGFLSGQAFNSNDSTATALTIVGLSMLNGADTLVESDSDGRINTPTTTGSARVIFFTTPPPP